MSLKMYTKALDVSKKKRKKIYFQGSIVLEVPNTEVKKKLSCLRHSGFVYFNIFTIRM